MSERPSCSQVLTIPDLVSSWATATPDAIALLAPVYAPLTYDRLYLQCLSVVQHLRALGLARTDHMALVLPHGTEMAQLIEEQQAQQISNDVLAGLTC